MEMENVNELVEQKEILHKVSLGEEVCWGNPCCGKVAVPGDLSAADIDSAEKRLRRFAPFIQRCFPETQSQNGIIESPLVPINAMAQKMLSQFPGRLLLKMDSDLAIAGSVKARGGIYEVLKHAEELAIQNGMLHTGDNYEKLDSDEFRRFFGQYSIQVGSTGNLGMSIGIMGAALGFRTVVHMSQDARQWKKDLLRSNGVTVLEYTEDYSAAVENGRRLSDQDPMSYFVDDEQSKNLFLGYSVAAKRLVPQLENLGVDVDEDHPLFVYIPCGVGGAPGGITFGLKYQFGPHVHCFFVEPVQAPCMLIGMATGRHSDICVKDLGLTGFTHADGLAVGRPSGFVGKMMEPMLAGEFTIKDAALYDYMRLLLDTEGLFVEPSACAAFVGPQKLLTGMKQYLVEHELTEKMDNSTHIVWATGGRLVPEDVRREYIQTHL